MSRPVIFDATHIILRQHITTPTGIDRVDHAFATSLSRCEGAGKPMAGGVVTFGAGRFTRRVNVQRVSELAQALSVRWGEKETDAADDVNSAFHQFLLGQSDRTQFERKKPSGAAELVRRMRNLARISRHFLRDDADALLPEGAIYLNVTQNPILVPRAGRWLLKRPDLKPVFLIHDLIPVDFPEYFPNDRRGHFDNVLNTMFQHSAALITTTEVVKERIVAEQKKRGAPGVPVHVAPLPLPPGFDNPAPRDEALAKHRYVAMVGTIEPRKNHWLMLNLWNQMIARGDDPPKLVIVGAKGWQNEAVERIIAGAPNLRGHVIHLSGLSNDGLRKTIAHAQALLMPSFAEGYGIPVIEALSLGTPIIGSDIPVFAEVSQGAAVLVDPLDGPGWRREILQIAGPQTPLRTGPVGPLAGFTPPQVAPYFEDIRGFLDNL